MQEGQSAFLLRVKETYAESVCVFCLWADGVQDAYAKRFWKRTPIVLAAANMERTGGMMPLAI